MLSLTLYKPHVDKETIQELLLVEFKEGKEMKNAHIEKINHFPEVSQNDRKDKFSQTEIMACLFHFFET